jgi:acylphosphatase
MKKRRVHVWIAGRVHGVFFRAYTRDTALLAGVSGWVRNLPDGRVEAIFEGNDESVESVVNWCREGSPMSHVDNVEILEEVYIGEFDNFRITY